MITAPKRKSWRVVQCVFSNGLKCLYLARIGTLDILSSIKQTCQSCHKIDKSLSPASEDPEPPGPQLFGNHTRRARSGSKPLNWIPNRGLQEESVQKILRSTYLFAGRPAAATADDVSNVKVSDEDAYLSRSMTIKANNKAVKERNCINRVASEFVFHVTSRHRRSVA